MRIILAILPLAFLAVTEGEALRADWQVWTTTDTRRVLRDEPAGAARDVKLCAARNERRAFQVLLRSTAPVPGVRVEAGDLRGPDGAVLRAADATLYRQHQMELTTPTPRNDQFKPGGYPDALIPFVHPLTRQPLSGGRLAAVPFDLPAEQTHGFWVDLFVPPGAKPGEYRGVYRVVADGAKAVEIPVALTVWDFALPAVPTLRTALGSPAQRVRDYYRRQAKVGKEKEPADWDAVETQCAALAAEHGINATPPAGTLAPAALPEGKFAIPAEKIAALREFVDRYHVNALQVPHPASVVKDPEAQRDRLRAWLNAFDEAAAALDRPGVLFYVYLKDEPNDEEAYQYVRKWGRPIRDAHSVVKVLVVEQPQTQDPAWGDLYGAVDIWCPLFSLFEPEPAAQRRAQGELVWTYTALCQRQKTPWWHIDYPLLHYRVPAWIAWRYRISGLLYWGGMSHWSQVDDPWTDPKTYVSRGRTAPAYNGEGTLVYPARPVGYDGIAPSLRLKALRDAVHDYEYLAMLERLGRAADAEKVVLPLAGSWFQWEPDPAAYDRARTRLAELILSAKKP